MTHLGLFVYAFILSVFSSYCFPYGLYGKEENAKDISCVISKSNIDSPDDNSTQRSFSYSLSDFSIASEGTASTSTPTISPSIEIS